MYKKFEEQRLQWLRQKKEDLKSRIEEIGELEEVFIDSRKFWVIKIGETLVDQLALRQIAELSYKKLIGNGNCFDLSTELVEEGFATGCFTTKNCEYSLSPKHQINFLKLSSGGYLIFDFNSGGQGINDVGIISIFSDSLESGIKALSFLYGGNWSVI